MPGPMRPEEVQLRRGGGIPRVVYGVIDALIARHWNGRNAVVSLGLIRTFLQMIDFNPEEIVCMMDVEDAYRDQGWTVERHESEFGEVDRGFLTFTWPGSPES